MLEGTTSGTPTIDEENDTYTHPLSGMGSTFFHFQYTCDICNELWIKCVINYFRLGLKTKGDYTTRSKVLRLSHQRRFSIFEVSVDGI